MTVTDGAATDTLDEIRLYCRAHPEAELRDVLEASELEPTRATVAAIETVKRRLRHCPWLLPRVRGKDLLLEEQIGVEAVEETAAVE